MAKAKQTKGPRFQLQKRFDVHLAVTVSADSLERAVEKAKSLQFQDVLTAKDDVEVWDWNPLPGTGAHEEW